MILQLAPLRLLVAVLAASNGGDGGRFDGGTAPDAAADPWQADSAAAAEQRTAIEQKARRQCAPFIAALKNSARYSGSEAPGVRQSTEAAYGQALERCLGEARARYRWEADALASGAALAQRRRAEVQRQDDKRRDLAAQAEAKAREDAEKEAAKQAADERESAARFKDPGFMQAQLSAQLCYVASSRKHAKAMIDDERDGARAGLGVIDKNVAYQWQGEIVTMSKLERLAKAELHDRKLSPLRCKDDAAAKDFSDCISDARENIQLDPDADTYLEVAKQIAEYAPSCTPWKRLTPEAPGGN